MAMMKAMINKQAPARTADSVSNPLQVNNPIATAVPDDILRQLHDVQTQVLYRIDITNQSVNTRQSIRAL